MTSLMGIIADDFTGANDSGVQLIKQGMNTTVIFDLSQKIKRLDPGIVIDIDSRGKSGEEAESLTKEATQLLIDSGYKIIYKKMDSMLRGHLGRELVAIDHILQPEFVLIAPAFPANDRKTINGIHYVNGIEVSKTEASKDRQHPVVESSIIKLLETQTNKRIGHLTLADIRGNCDNDFTKKIQFFRSNHITYLVCDGETEADLRLLVKKMSSITNNILWAGSAGLAEAVSENIVAKDQTKNYIPPKQMRTLSVCGSLSSVTKQQVNYGLKQSNVFGLQVNTVKMLTKDWATYQHKCKEKCLQALSDGKDIILHVSSDEKVQSDVEKIRQQKQWSINETGHIIASRLAELASKIITKDELLTGLILTGGETAKYTATELGGTGFNLIKEIEPGIPLGSFTVADRTFYAVTKAGAMGKQDSIYNAMKQLKGVNHENE